MKKRLWMAGLAGIMVVMMAVPSMAVIIPMKGLNDDTLSASVDFTYNPVSYEVSIDVTNTSANFDPRLTAFAFNLPANVTGFSFSGPAGWSGKLAWDGINTPGQLGKWDLAALTGPNFNGGSPNSGIARDATAHFSFTLAGSNLGALTEASFLDLPSKGYAGPEVLYYFAARFQQTGPDGEGSDVAVDPPPSVPEPGTLLLFAMGLGACGVPLRRRARG